VPWLLAVPALLALVLFHFAPIGVGAYYAFTDWDGFGFTHARWVGLANFRRVFDDPIARGALWHTLELAGCFVVLVNAIGLSLAIALNRAVKSRHLLRVLFFAPVALSPLAISFIWRWAFEYYGGLNLALDRVGLGSWKQDWLGNYKLALWSILVVMVWQFSGLAMVLYLAGLQAIPDDVYEATLVDGASTWLRLRRVVLPLLAPAITVSATMTLIIGLRVFDQVKALTDGGPATATETLATQVWRQTFYLGYYGYGTAVALVLTTLITALALLQLALLRANEQRL
jgi:raffinose/stachyose/melibiose transport system permease protein